MHWAQNNTICLKNEPPLPIPNKTQEIRPNLHFGILPQNPNYVFYKRENNGLIFLDVDESFYLEKKFLNKEYLDNLLEKKLWVF